MEVPAVGKEGVDAHQEVRRTVLPDACEEWLQTLSDAGARTGEVRRCRESMEAMRKFVASSQRLRSLKQFLRSSMEDANHTIDLDSISTTHRVHFSAFATNVLANSMGSSLSNFVANLMNACKMVSPKHHIAEERPGHILPLLSLRIEVAKAFWEVLQSEDLSSNSVRDRSMEACSSLWTQFAAPAVEEERAVLQGQLIALDTVMEFCSKARSRCGLLRGTDAVNEMQKMQKSHSSRLRTSVLRISQMTRSQEEMCRIGLCESEFLALASHRHLSDEEAGTALNWLSRRGDLVSAFCSRGRTRIATLLSLDEEHVCWRGIDIAEDADPDGRIALQPPSHLGVFCTASRVSVGPDASGVPYIRGQSIPVVGVMWILRRLVSEDILCLNKIGCRLLSFTVETDLSRIETRMGEILEHDLFEIGNCYGLEFSPLVLSASDPQREGRDAELASSSIEKKIEEVRCAFDHTLRLGRRSRPSTPAPPVSTPVAESTPSPRRPPEIVGACLSVPSTIPCHIGTLSQRVPSEHAFEYETIASVAEFVKEKQESPWNHLHVLVDDVGRRAVQRCRPELIPKAKGNAVSQRVSGTIKRLVSASEGCKSSMDAVSAASMLAEFRPATKKSKSSLVLSGLGDVMLGRALFLNLCLKVLSAFDSDTKLPVGATWKMEARTVRRHRAEGEANVSRMHKWEGA